MPVEVVLLRVVERLELLLGNLDFHTLASHSDVQKDFRVVKVTTFR